MGKGESQEWSEEQEDTKQTQPERHQKTESKRSGRSCPTCCLKTRDCLMSNECGRALQISSVVAWCGMCIRMWVCKCQKGFPAAILPINYANVLITLCALTLIRRQKKRKLELQSIVS